MTKYVSILFKILTFKVSTVPVPVLSGTVRNYAGTVPTYVNMMYLLVSVPLLSTYVSAYGYVLPVYHIWCYEESVGYVFPLPYATYYVCATYFREFSQKQFIKDRGCSLKITAILCFSVLAVLVTWYSRTADLFVEISKTPCRYLILINF